MLLSSRMNQYLNRSVNRFLQHTYTSTDNDTVPVLDVNNDPTYNDWDQPIVTDATPVTNKPCLFLYEEVSSTDENGPVTLRVPTLYVKSDDTISVHDIVSAVTSRDGTTVLIEAARVESIDFTAEAGNPTLKVLRLSGAVTV